MMKYNQLLIMTFLLSFLLGCTKDKLDYRQQFVGEYSFEYCYRVTAPNPELCDTITYKGFIRMEDEDSEYDDRIYIDLPNGSEKMFSIDEAGTLMRCGDAVGSIVSETVQFELDDDQWDCVPGPLGWNYLVTVTGTKL